MDSTQIRYSWRNTLKLGRQNYSECSLKRLFYNGGGGGKQSKQYESGHRKYRMENWPWTTKILPQRSNQFWRELRLLASLILFKSTNTTKAGGTTTVALWRRAVTEKCVEGWVLIFLPATFHLSGCCRDEELIPVKVTKGSLPAQWITQVLSPKPDRKVTHQKKIQRGNNSIQKRNV